MVSLEKMDGDLFEEGTILNPHEKQLDEDEYREKAKVAIENKNGGLGLFG